MPCAISLPLPTSGLNAGFTVRDDTLLYADIPRVPIDELRKLLSRGSGKVVREGQRSKVWFRAQCAHYGLPTDGTLAMLRLYLENSLKSFQERMREKADRLEKERLALDKRSRRQTERPAERTPRTLVRPPAVRTNLATSASSSSSLQSSGTTHIEPAAAALKVANDSISPPSLPVLIPTTKLSLQSSQATEFEQVKLNMKFSESSGSSTDTESESEADSSLSISELRATLPPPGLSSPLFHPNPPRFGRDGTRVRGLENDVVSGRWALHVTCSTMEPLPAPWRAASSKWLRGDMDVHLSKNRRSLTAEFALFGLDGIIKSQKFEPRGEGVCVWVRFVAQMPITTAVKPGDDGLHENCIFGPSDLQFGYLRFYGEGRIKGMLRCKRYGRLEFEGVRIGKPRELCKKWRDFVEN